MLGIWLALLPLVVVQSWRGRKRKRWELPWYLMASVVICGVGSVLSGCTSGGSCNLNVLPPEAICTSHFPNGTGPDERYEDYGFLLGGFSEDEIEVLGGTIQGYASHVGGAGQLKKLMVCGNGGSLKSVCKDPVGIGSDASIRLGTTAFDTALAQSNNYSNYGALSDDERGQISFGHEIGHNLVRVLRPAEDWAEKYKNNVSRGDGADWTDTFEAEQEAVTNIALYVLEKAYFWSTYPVPSHREEDETRIADIENWAHNFVNALKRF